MAKNIILMVCWLMFVSAGSFMIVLWVRYPECGSGYVTAVNPNSMTGWVCVQGFEPPWPRS
jgi:hypothetical protein